MIAVRCFIIIIIIINHNKPQTAHSFRVANSPGTMDDDSDDDNDNAFGSMSYHGELLTKDQKQKIEENLTNLNTNEITTDESKLEKNDKVIINLKALDKITAKTSAFKLALGEKKFFGPLEIVVQKCLLSENDDFSDSVAFLQVKDLSSKDNNQVFLFNGWTFASSPTLQSIDHPVYDLWITSCENI